MIQIKPNIPLENNYQDIKIFLAGSIENGKAEPWQEKFVESFENQKVVIFNPRRDDWNSNIVQSINDSNFNQQVNWELDALNLADIIVFYFDPNTISPISLLELGRMTANYKDSNQLVIVCCPEGYFRKGNIEIVCSREDVPLTSTLEELIQHVKIMISYRNISI